MSGPLAITAFVASIVLAIMLHELGHFLTARRFGMRADRFFLGFGPTLWSIRRGETEFGVKALPLGGFVRIIGMSPEDERLPPLAVEVYPDGAEVADADLDELARAASARGVRPQVVERIVRRTRAVVAAGTTPADARARLHEILVTEVGSPERVGDLAHRLVEGDTDRFFHERPAWQRAVVLVSGSVAHFIIAIAVLAGAYAFLPQWTGGFDTRVAFVEPGAPADDAGLLAGDRVVEVDGVVSDDYQRLRDEIRARPGTPTRLVVQRDGSLVDLTVVPEPTEDPEASEVVGVVGFVPELDLRRMDPVAAMEHALLGEPSLGNPGGFIPMFSGSISALANVFSPSGIVDILRQATGQEERSMEGAVSLVGAASIAGQVGDDALGLVLFLGLIAVVNVFIGIFNLVPLPPLDGGHLAALGIERAVNLGRRLRGRREDYKLDPRTLAAVAVPVLAILAVIVLALLWMDITDPIRLG